MEKRSLFDASTLDAVTARIDSLTADTQPRWGKMDVAQMLAHCAEVQEVANGKELRNSPWYLKLFRGIIRRMVLSTKPYPRQSATHPQYVVASQEDFGQQKERLLQAIRSMHDQSPAKAEQIKHPLFGSMTADEKGWAMYKHLDHHLTQFGV